MTPPLLHEVDMDPAVEDESMIHPAMRARIASVVDVVIPAHLLQATSAVDSAGDAPSWQLPSWQLRRQLTMRNHRIPRRPLPIHRASTLPSSRASPTHSRESSRPATRDSWRMSFTPGVPERLTTSNSLAQEYRDLLRPDASHDFATWQWPPAERPRENSFSSYYTAVDDSTECLLYPPAEPEKAHAGARSRRGTVETIGIDIIPEAPQKQFTNASSTNMSSSTVTRMSTMRNNFEKARRRGKQLERNKWTMLAFEYFIYAFILLFIYFILIGMPLWKGAVWWTYWVVSNKFVFQGGFAITLGIALLYAFGPLFALFEKDPPPPDIISRSTYQQNIQDTALLIPCYKSANLIAATLEAALKIFPPSHIYVLANGNSPEPLDNTEEICRPYEVNHLWLPVGSKIVAQFVGCYAAKGFKNVLLIDDDCALPENFPVVTDRLQGNVKCIGYTIKSVGPNSSKGNYCQQAQDLEYKLSGLQKDVSGRIGSATFPHGAIALWDRELLVKTFYEHPGFSVSEDWFFGHAARKLGCRIQMCSSVFVETETPKAIFFSSGGSRGGFGEMTVFQQRFKRWNFFFVNGIWYNMGYIFASWKLGWWELGAKIFVFQEVYETLLYLLTPVMLPISFIVQPFFAGVLIAATAVMYLINVIIFNEIHLRRKNERIGWVVLYLYYLPYKVILTFVNVVSCYWSIWKYARYFATRHPKVVEDEKAVSVVIRLEESADPKECALGRSVTVRTVGLRSASDSGWRRSSVSSQLGDWVGAKHEAESPMYSYGRKAYICSAF